MPTRSRGTPNLREVAASPGRPSYRPRPVGCFSIAAVGVDDPVWHPTVYAKNRDRLFEGAVAERFLAAILADPKVKPFLKRHKNDYRDSEAIAEAVGRATMRFVPLKSPEQLDLQALHRVRSRLIGQRAAVINQIRGILLECGIPVRQGAASLRRVLPDIRATRSDVLSSRLLRLIQDLADDWRRLDARIDDVTSEISAAAAQDADCQRLMSAPGIGPITASAMVAAIATCARCSFKARGRCCCGPATGASTDTGSMARASSAASASQRRGRRARK
jgi:hypothetical protein